MPASMQSLPQGTQASTQQPPPTYRPPVCHALLEPTPPLRGPPTPPTAFLALLAPTQGPLASLPAPCVRRANSPMWRGCARETLAASCAQLEPTRVPGAGHLRATRANQEAPPQTWGPLARLLVPYVKQAPTLMFGGGTCASHAPWDHSPISGREHSACPAKLAPTLTQRATYSAPHAPQAPMLKMREQLPASHARRGPTPHFHGAPFPASLAARGPTQTRSVLGLFL